MGLDVRFFRMGKEIFGITFFFLGGGGNQYGGCKGAAKSYFFFLSLLVCVFLRWSGACPYKT